MKPIINVIEVKGDDNKITLTREELQELIDQAYYMGQADAENKNTAGFIKDPTIMC